MLTYLLCMIYTNAKELFCHSFSVYFKKLYVFDNNIHKQIHNNKTRQQFAAEALQKAWKQLVGVVKRRHILFKYWLINWKK